MAEWREGWLDGSVDEQPAPPPPVEPTPIQPAADVQAEGDTKGREERLRSFYLAGFRAAIAKEREEHLHSLYLAGFRAAIAAQKRRKP